MSTNTGRRRIRATYITNAVLIGSRLTILWIVGMLSVGHLSAQTLDSTFNSGTGSFSLDRSGQDESVGDLVIDSQGRILLAFLFQDGFGDFRPHVLRLLPTGAPDLSFGVLGLWQETLTFAVGSLPIRITVDGSDRPIVGWTFEFDQLGEINRDWAIRRVTTAGVSDLFMAAAFDWGAFGHQRDELWDLEVQLDGRLAATGGAQFAGLDYDVAIAIWKPTAGTDSFTPDTAFDTDGLKVYAFDLGGTDTDIGHVIGYDGANVIVGGMATTASGSHMAMARMNATTGVFDNTFAGDGRADYAYVPFGGAAWPVNAINALIPSGLGYIVAGYVSDATEQHGALLRIDEQGTVDISWANLGWALAQVPYPGLFLDPGKSTIGSIEISPDGMLIAAGFVVHPTNHRTLGFVGRWSQLGFEQGLETFGFEPAGEPNATTFFPMRHDLTGSKAVVAGNRFGESGGSNRSDRDLLVARIHLADLLFLDGFESGSVSAWSSSAP